MATAANNNRRPNSPTFDTNFSLKPNVANDLGRSFRVFKQEDGRIVFPEGLNRPTSETPTEQIVQKMQDAVQREAQQQMPAIKKILSSRGDSPQEGWVKAIEVK